MKQIFNQPTERRLAKRIPDSFTSDTIPDSDGADDDMLLDNLIARSVSQLDRSPGLPSNFAYRTAMLAAAEAMERRARAERREHLLSWLIPTMAAVAAVVAVVIAVPDLPWIIADSFIRDSRSMAQHTDLPTSATWLIGIIAVVGALLFGLNTVLRRMIAKRVSDINSER